MDNDGDLDVVYTANIGGKSNLVVWDGQTNTLLMPTFETPPGLTNTTSGAAGRPTIADFDNDGLNEIGYAGKEIYVMIDDVLDAAAPKLVWSILNTDRSARTGSTVFDFEADGQAEIVYRDETDLFVLRGSDGAELFKTACRSGTRFEYPVTRPKSSSRVTIPTAASKPSSLQTHLGPLRVRCGTNTRITSPTSTTT